MSGINRLAVGRLDTHQSVAYTGTAGTEPLQTFIFTGEEILSHRQLL